MCTVYFTLERETVLCGLLLREKQNVVHIIDIKIQNQATPLQSPCTL